MRSVFLLGAVVDVALAVGLFVAGSLVRELSVLRLASFVALVAAAGLIFLWQRFVPRGLRADTSQIVYLGITDQRMTRSDLAQIFRGLTFFSGRSGGSWEKSYVFATNEGRMAFAVPAAWFTEEGVAALAGRLGVPMRGDFTVRVKDRVDGLPT